MSSVLQECYNTVGAGISCTSRPNSLSSLDQPVWNVGGETYSEEYYKENIEGAVLVNMIECPDGTILESLYRHDYKTYEQEDGRSYMVDGGTSYIRRGASCMDYKEMSCFVSTDHMITRELFKWGSYGKYGDEPLHHILLKDISDEHLVNIIQFLKGANRQTGVWVMLWRELEYRLGHH